MKTSKLLDGVDYEVLSGNIDIWVENITHKACDIQSGFCYIMLHNDIKAISDAKLALLNGATIIISEIDFVISEFSCQIKVDDIRAAYSMMAKMYHHRKCDHMKMIGVIGTNGKSTTSYLVWSLLSKNNIRTGFIGTGFYMIGDTKHDTDSTTPDPMQLHNILFNMELSGVKIVVMEVSAHAICLKKIEGIKFEIGIFTNLSQDHLDYFENMENLKNVKQSFFLKGKCKIAIINNDDICGIELIEQMKSPYLTYGVACSSNKLAGIEEKDCNKYPDQIVVDNAIDINVECCDMEIFANNIKWVNCVNNFDITLLGRVYNATSKLVGVFNVYNILSSILAVQLCNVRIDRIIKSLAEISPLAGRCNIIENVGVKYIIDYAHSPDGLENIIKEAREITLGRVITVFGCGGERDKSKRGLMGEIANSLSDIVIITEDNSRSEEVECIMTDIYRGIRGDTSNVYLVKNRCDATLLANSLAAYNDTIILAGKGSEEYIEQNSGKYKYSDKTTIEEILDIKWI